MTPKQIITNVLALYEDPKRWGRNFFYSDANPYKRCYCLGGAILLSEGGGKPGERPNGSYLKSNGEAVMDLLASEIPKPPDGPKSTHGQIFSFNDDPATTLDDVRGVLQRALAKLEGAGAV